MPEFADPVTIGVLAYRSRGSGSGPCHARQRLTLMRDQYLEHVPTLTTDAVSTTSQRVQSATILVFAIVLIATGTTRMDIGFPAWSIALFIGAMLVMDWLVQPGDATRRAESPVFLFVVVAAVLFNPVVAAGMTVLSVFSGDLFRPEVPQQVSATIRALLGVGLVGAGALTMNFDFLVPAFFLLWIGFIAYWLAQQRMVGNNVVARFHLVMLAWVGAMLAMPLYVGDFPPGIRDALILGVPTLHFALGFMTADTALVTGRGLSLYGQRGLSFWRRELVPTFTRYNLMAVSGALVATASLMAGFTGFSLSMGLIWLVFLIWREREVGQRRLVSSVCVLSSALDARDSYTRGHADRVSSYSVAIAERLGWSGRARRDLELAAHLHDIGKVGVPDDILLKPGRFTSDDFEAMKEHSAIGAAIVMNSPELRHIAPVVRQHHERLDGSGYPDGLGGNEVLPAARIIGAADAFDAMTSNRPYRDAMDRETALGIISRGRGTEFDPDVVDALIELAETDRLEAVLEYGYCLTH